ncbi:hypothetical protein CDAR_169321 [Caerostris darwini]|uniref:Uncharacterized protein n=1 Tax=Caerostris darwini TaxID=1538125 RepID=A0AAV4QFL0_9ARAC|nr:hypothetical protein CDAR_169321 [Caerostris darwini]
MSTLEPSPDQRKQQNTGSLNLGKSQFWKKHCPTTSSGRRTQRSKERGTFPHQETTCDVHYTQGLGRDPLSFSQCDVAAGPFW